MGGWGGGGGLELCVEPCVPPVNTVLHGQSDGKFVWKEAGLRAQRGTLCGVGRGLVSVASVL